MNHLFPMYVCKALRDFIHLKEVALRLAVHAIEVALTIASLSTDDGLFGSEKKARRSPKVQRGATIPMEGIAGSLIKPNRGSTFGWQRSAQTRYSLFKSWWFKLNKNYGRSRKGEDTRLLILPLSFRSIRFVVCISKDFDGDLDARQCS